MDIVRVILQSAGYLIFVGLLTYAGNHAIRLVLDLSKVRKLPLPKEELTPAQATAAEEPVLNAGRYRHP